MMVMQHFDGSCDYAEEDADDICDSDDADDDNDGVVDTEDCNPLDYSSSAFDCCGVCGGDGSTCVCPEMYEPVCGVNGQTYQNSCYAACDGVAIDHDGVCIISGCTYPEAINYDPSATPSHAA
jgi:hypothetical protein